MWSARFKGDAEPLCALSMVARCHAFFLDLTLALTSVHSAVLKTKNEVVGRRQEFGVYQSRLVAKDFRPKNKIDDCEGLYAATLPLEVVKVLIMQAATKCRQVDVRKSC